MDAMVVAKKLRNLMKASGADVTTAAWFEPKDVYRGDDGVAQFKITDSDGTIWMVDVYK